MPHKLRFLAKLLHFPKRAKSVHDVLPLDWRQCPRQHCPCPSPSPCRCPWRRVRLISTYLNFNGNLFSHIKSFRFPPFQIQKCDVSKATSKDFLFQAVYIYLIGLIILVDSPFIFYGSIYAPHAQLGCRSPQRAPELWNALEAVHALPEVKQVINLFIIC